MTNPSSDRRGPAVGPLAMLPRLLRGRGVDNHVRHYLRVGQFATSRQFETRLRKSFLEFSVGRSLCESSS